jgi:hypothetical protein
MIAEAPRHNRKMAGGVDFRRKRPWRGNAIAEGVV